MSQSADPQTHPEKNAKDKVSDFFTKAPESIRQTINENNSTFWTKLQEKAQTKKENENEGTDPHQNKEKPDQVDQNTSKNHVDIVAHNQQEAKNEQNKSSKQNGQQDKQSVEIPQKEGKKLDQVKDFFTSSTTIVQQKAGSSYGQMLESIKKKGEENKQKKQEKEQINPKSNGNIVEESAKKETVEQNGIHQGQKENEKASKETVISSEHKNIPKSEKKTEESKNANTQEKTISSQKQIAHAEDKPSSEKKSEKNIPSQNQIAHPEDKSKKEQKPSESNIPSSKQVGHPEEKPNEQKKSENNIPSQKQIVPAEEKPKSQQTPSEQNIPSQKPTAHADEKANQKPTTSEQKNSEQSQPKERPIQKLAYFFTNSTTAVGAKASEQYQNFKDKIQEKSQKKHEGEQLDKSFQHMIEEEEEKKRERIASFESSKKITKILPHNHHYDEESQKESRKQSHFQEDSFEEDRKPRQVRQSNAQQNIPKRKESHQQQERAERSHLSKSPNSQKFTLKRKNSGKSTKQNELHSNNSVQQNSNHVYVRHFVEKEFDKEEKLREAARKKRELELELLQINQELIHLKKDIDNEERSPNQYVVKKGKVIPPIKEQNQVKAMIQISDNKQALEDAMNLVKRMNQERKLKEQQQQQRMQLHSAKFKDKIQQFRDNDEEYFQQKELSRKNEIISRMQEYEYKKLEGMKLQNASKQFVKDLMQHGPLQGKISENYKSNVQDIQKEFDVNLSQVRSSKLQTPLLEQKKLSLQNKRNLEDNHKTEQDEEIIDRDMDEEYEMKDNEEDGQNFEQYQRSEGKSAQKMQNNYLQSSMPNQQSKKNYGSIFTKRVIAHDQQIKQMDRMLSEEKKQLYEKRMSYAKVVKRSYQPKHIVDNYNFYQDALFLKQKMKVSDQMNIDYYRPGQKESPLRASLPSQSQEYQKYSKEPNNYIEANRAWKIHNKVILNHEYPQSEQIKKLQF